MKKGLLLFVGLFSILIIVLAYFLSEEDCATDSCQLTIAMLSIQDDQKRVEQLLNNKQHIKASYRDLKLALVSSLVTEEGTIAVSTRNGHILIAEPLISDDKQTVTWRCSFSVLNDAIVSKLKSCGAETDAP